VRAARPETVVRNAVLNDGDTLGISAEERIAVRQAERNDGWLPITKSSQVTSTGLGSVSPRSGATGCW